MRGLFSGRRKLKKKMKNDSWKLHKVWKVLA